MNIVFLAPEIVIQNVRLSYPWVGKDLDLPISSASEIRQKIFDLPMILNTTKF